MQLKKISYALGLTAILTLSLSACGTMDRIGSSSKIDYKSQVEGSPLEVPPGLTDYEKNKQFSLDGTGVRYSTVSQDPTGKVSKELLVTPKDMSIHKAGDARWLVVKRPAEQVWPVLQDFWEENGFTLRTNSPKLGLMETDWAENRAGAGMTQTGLRKILGSAVGALYDTGLRDMFKTRVERTADGVEIYISNRGLEEVYTSTSKDTTVWQPRAPDPELEAEFLRRLMVKLGSSESDSKVALADAVNTNKGSTISGGTLIVSDTMDNTWRRVGLSLDRAGLSVVDRDYASRVYFVTPNPDDRGIFKKTFGKLKETYQVKFKSLSDTQTEVSFFDKNGTQLSANDSGVSRVLKNLKSSLK